VLYATIFLMDSNNEMIVAENKFYGPPEVVKLVKRSRPEPSARQILVRVFASTVSSADSRIRSRNVPRGFGFMISLLYGFSHPKYDCLGTNLAGEVVAIGKDVNKFKVGDRVVADLGMKLGGHAQFKLLNENDVIAKIPSDVSYIQAASLVFGGSTALCFLRDKLKLQSGERLLVIGAGGAVGSAAVQIGRLMGAHVVGVCSSEKVADVRALGANEVIDYKLTDWKSTPERYDVILDNVGVTNFEFGKVRHKLSPHGRMGLVVADLPANIASIWISIFNRQKVIAGSIAVGIKDLEYLLNLCNEKLLDPLISKKFSIEKIVEAHKIVDSGHKLGSVVIEF
jgi:NADPH:quinone reductase-like Zn-dependent oxidoreductase